MTSESRYVGRPVRSLQSMLHFISLSEPSIPLITESGSFDDATRDAVRAFQKLSGLPESGTADHETWDRIAQTYHALKRAYSAPRSLDLFSDPKFSLLPGERSMRLCVVQAMFTALSRTLREFSPCPVTDGVLSGAAEQDTLRLQHCGQLDETGRMDKQTWDLLVRLYDLFIIRTAELPS